MVILITGAITPAGNIAKTALTDSEKRKEQYILSIEKTIDQLSQYKLDTVNANKVIRDVSLVYCDNSDPSLEIFDEVKDYAKKKNIAIELLLFKGDNEAVSKKGKGYGEGEITKYAFKNSEFIKKASFIFKLTGRLTIDNLSEIIKKIDISKMYFNVPNKTRRDICDTRFYALSKDNYEKFFINAYENVDDNNNHFLEHVFIESIRNNKLKVYNFPKYPLYSGMSGTAGTNYSYVGWKSKIKDIMSLFGYYRVK